MYTLEKKHGDIEADSLESYQGDEIYGKPSSKRNT